VTAWFGSYYQAVMVIVVKSREVNPHHKGDDLYQLENTGGRESVDEY